MYGEPFRVSPACGRAADEHGNGTGKGKRRLACLGRNRIRLNQPERKRCAAKVGQRIPRSGQFNLYLSGKPPVVPGILSGWLDWILPH